MAVVKNRSTKKSREFWKHVEAIAGQSKLYRTRVARMEAALKQVTEMCEDGDTGADFKTVVAAMWAAKHALEWDDDGNNNDQILARMA